MEPIVRIISAQGTVHGLRCNCHLCFTTHHTIAVILATGVFQFEYTNWHTLPTGERNLLSTWNLWAKKVLLGLQFSKDASNMDPGMAYGMNSADTAHKELGGIIKDFAQGHTATQTTIQNLTQGFPDLRA